MKISLQKAPKLFFYDTGDVIGTDGARFENLVACELLKRNHFIEDSQGFRRGLFYLRDKEKHEVDFVLVQDGVVEELIEVKVSDSAPSPALLYFADKLKPKRLTQIVQNLAKPYRKNGVDVVDPISYFAGASLNDA